MTRTEQPTDLGLRPRRAEIRRSVLALSSGSFFWLRALGLFLLFVLSGRFSLLGYGVVAFRLGSTRMLVLPLLACLSSLRILGSILSLNIEALFSIAMSGKVEGLARTVALSTDSFTSSAGATLPSSSATPSACCGFSSSFCGSMVNFVISYVHAHDLRGRAPVEAGSAAPERFRV